MKTTVLKVVVVSLVICFSATGRAQDSFDELSKKGNAELVGNNYTKALEYFDAAIKAGNEDKSKIAWTASIAATCAEQIKNDTKALKYYNLAIENNTIDETIFDAALGLSKKMKDNECHEKILLTGRDRFEHQYNRYTSKLLYFYYNAQMYEKVPAIADEVLKYKPNHLKTFYLKGAAYLNTGNEADAIRAFENALTQDSLDEKTNRQLGFLYFNKGQTIYNNANDKYNALVKPSRVDYSNYRKTITNSYASFKKASVYLERAYQVNSDEKIRKALFTLYTRLEQKSNADKYK